MADISKIDDVAVANIAKIMGRTKAAGDDVMGVLFPSVAGGIIESIQEVEITIASSSATGTATISSITTGNSAIFCSYPYFGMQRQTASGNAADDIICAVDITNSTTVTATRSSAPAFAITLVVTVVEYKSTAVTSVQQGTVSMTGAETTSTDTITSVNTSRSVVVCNGATNDNTTVNLVNSASSLTLTNSTTVTAVRGNAVGVFDQNYVVIEFASGVVDSVQPFEISITDTGATTNTATISSVTTADSVIFPAGQRLGATTFHLEDSSAHVKLTNATTLTITRNTAGTRVPTITGTVVEWASGNVESVQRGTVTMASGDTTKDVTVTSVTVANSVVTALTATGTSSLNFAPQAEFFTSEIVNSTTIRFHKGLTGKVVILSWELMEYT